MREYFKILILVLIFFEILILGIFILKNIEDSELIFEPLYLSKPEIMMLNAKNIECWYEYNGKYSCIVTRRIK